MPRLLGRGRDKIGIRAKVAALKPLGLFRRGIGMEFQKEPSGFPVDSRPKTYKGRSGYDLCGGAKVSALEPLGICSREELVLIWK